MTNVRAIAITKKYPFRKDDAGRRICAVCGKRCSLKYCSTECREAALVECNPAHARYRVWQRDHGVCARCGWATGVIERIIWWFHRWRWQEDTRETEHFLRSALGLGCRTHLWEAHHKVAVADGGGLCSLDGLETLCFRCHAKESGRQRRKRNAAKVAEKGA